MNQIMLDAISVAQQVFEAGEREERLEYVIAGETNLMGVAELSSVEKLRRLFEAFNEKRDILHLLDQSLKAEGRADLHRPRVGLPDPRRLQRGHGALQPPATRWSACSGVIGPTRMAYERVIPIVDMTAKLLGAALNSRR